MKEVEIKFDQGREGIVPVGTYLVDAAKRMGAASSFECIEEAGHDCKITVTSGSELLSDLTEAESELLTADERKRGIRLACFAKIEKPGVITAMVDKKKESSNEKEEGSRDEGYRKEFTELPLEKKIAELVHLEVIALGETFAFVINSPFKIFEKIGDVMAEFGFKKEEDEKRRARPAESGSHKSSGSSKKKASEKKSTNDEASS